MNACESKKLATFSSLTSLICFSHFSNSCFRFIINFRVFNQSARKKKKKKKRKFVNFLNFFKKNSLKKIKSLRFIINELLRYCINNVNYL